MSFTPAVVPFDQPKDSRRTIFFFGITAHDVTYRFTCAVATPFLTKQSRHQSKEPCACNIDGCRTKNAVGVCLSCGQSKLCAKHIGDLCPRCSALSPEDPTPGAIPAPTTPTPFPFTTACYMPGSGSTFVAILLSKLLPPMP